MYSSMASLNSFVLIGEASVQWWICTIAYILLWTMLTHPNTNFPGLGSSPPSDTTYALHNLTWENAPDLWVQMFDFPLEKLLVGNIGHSAIQFVSNLYVCCTLSLTFGVRNRGSYGTTEIHTRQDHLPAMAR